MSTTDATELIKKIKRIHIRSARMADSVMAGHYRSVFRGSGIEFEEVREYAPGDEIKSIDWKVTARMGRPYVKRFREERELVLMLMVDMSASGRFGTGESLKREAAAEIASILAFNAVRNNDKVGLILFTDEVERYIPPMKGSSHVWRVIKEILGFTPQKKGTDICEALSFLAKTNRKKTTAFLISDFLAEGYEPVLKRAARKHEIIAVNISDPGDFRLPSAGLVEAEDPETGQRFFLDCSNKKVRNRYEQDARERNARTLERLKQAKIDTVNLSTDESCVDALIMFFRARERRIRV